MRIRSIRPEFWSSEDVAEMDWHTRLVYIGLWSYVDDNGVGRDKERLIVASLFPLDDDLPESSRRVTGALRHLSDGGQVTRYSVDGKPYLHISAWNKHQRIEKASKGRYPLPTCEDAVFGEPSRNTPGALPEMSTPGEGEKGRRGEESSSSEPADAASDPEPREDVERLCSLLADRIEGNGAKRPSITKAWRDAARLLLDRDGRTERQAAWIIDWCQADEFWRSNILSMPKLREKFDQLVMKSGVADRPALRLAGPADEPILPFASDDRR